MTGGTEPELRLGLVLYGGVSLAVYIYGVVVEVQRLLRASTEFEAARPDSEGAERGGYAEALSKGGLSRASVDIIAGTSAGGINGILLAKALAAGGEVDAVKKLWIEEGGIAGLLHRLGDGDAESLLSTEVMEDQLAEGFGELDKGGGPGMDGALDLFVSATHLRGDCRQFRDSLGAEIDALKHRYVFQLKLRPGYSRDDFAPRPAAGQQAGPNGHLVSLSRATSAFPVAFEPAELARADGILGPQDEPSAWFADGGILNNKPFTEALQTIFTRSSDRPVRRWLLSVDPDPKLVDLVPAPGPKPAFDQIAVSAVTQIPRYQSIARDLESLEEHNVAVGRINAMVADLEWELSGGGPPEGGLSPPYRRLRIWALAEEIADRLILAARPSEPGRFDRGAVRRAFAAAAFRVLRDAGWESEAWAELPDLAFELRRAYYLIKLIAMAAEPVDDGGGGGEGPGPPGPGTPREALWDAFELITQSLWKDFAAEPIVFDKGEDSDSLNHQALAQGEERVAAALDGFAEAQVAAAEMAEGAIRDVSVWLRHPAPVGGEAAAFEVRLERVFEEFSRRDDFLLPIEMGGGLRHRDLVKHAQISPATATSTEVEPEKKLAGDTAGHFGGFLDEGWRKNDLLWGRLDAAEILVGAIMDGSSAEREPVLEAIQREILEAELPEAVEPGRDWRAYLEEHAIGDADVSTLPEEQIEGLKARAGFVLRGMLRKAAKEAEAGPPKPKKEMRRRVLGALDGSLKLVGRLAYPYVLILRGRAGGSEEPPD